MAQRFGGRYSPDEAGQASAPVKNVYQGAARTRVGWRSNLLFILPLPLIFRAFSGGASALALNLVALGTLLLAAWMTREGLRAEEAFEARKIARRPTFPRKMAGSVLTGLGLALAGFAAGGGIFELVVYAVLGTVLHGFAFGVDPMKSKGMEGIDEFQTDRVARAVDEAEKHLSAMSDAVKRAGDRQVQSRVERFQTAARDLFRTVENDPRDLTAARKYLGVYLVGARDATVKFADIYSRNQSVDAKKEYLALLDDLEQNFADRTQKMLLDDRSDLEIEIEVLRDRLQREGLRPNSADM